MTQDMERKALPRGRILVAAGLAALVACAGLYVVFGSFEFGEKDPVQRKVVRVQGHGQAKNANQAARNAKTGPSAGTDTAGNAGAKGSEAVPDPVADQNAVRLPSIASFEPGTVYSGTLGEITRLQAGSQIARADLALREVQVKLKEMERRLAGEAGEASRTGQSGQAGLEKRIQEAIAASLQATVQAEMARALNSLERQKSQSLRVIAVRGQGARLEAELAGPEGRLVVRAGESLGAARVDSISSTRVIVDGAPLPWR